MESAAAITDTYIPIEIVCMIGEHAPGAFLLVCHATLMHMTAIIHQRLAARAPYKLTDDQTGRLRGYRHMVPWREFVEVVNSRRTNECILLDGVCMITPQAPAGLSLADIVNGGYIRQVPNQDSQASDGRTQGICDVFIGHNYMATITRDSQLYHISIFGRYGRIVCVENSAYINGTDVTRQGRPAEDYETICELIHVCLSVLELIHRVYKGVVITDDRCAVCEREKNYAHVNVLYICLQQVALII